MAYYEITLEDWRRATEPRFVGATKESQRKNKTPPDGYGSIDSDRLDDYERTAFLVDADLLHSLQLSVFDVDRKDVWDEVLRQLSAVLPGTTDLAGGPLASALDLSSDLQAAIARKLSGPNDRLIATRGVRLAAEDSEVDIDFSVTAGDYRGNYRFNFRLRKS